MSALAGAAGFAQRARHRVIAQDARAFERLAQVLVLAMFLNIASGAFVRLTGSGLGCPDWPLCKGQPVPPFNYHPVIEFSNRAIALAGILAALLTYLSARRVADRTRAPPRRRRRPAHVRPDPARRRDGALRPQPAARDEPLPGRGHGDGPGRSPARAAVRRRRHSGSAAAGMARVRQRRGRIRADRQRDVLDGGRPARRRAGHPPHGQPARRDLRARARRDDLRDRRDALPGSAAIRLLAARSLARPRARAARPRAAAGLHRRVPVAQPAAVVGRAGPRLAWRRRSGSCASRWPPAWRPAAPRPCPTRDRARRSARPSCARPRRSSRLPT